MRDINDAFCQLALSPFNTCSFIPVFREKEKGSPELFQYQCDQGSGLEGDNKRKDRKIHYSGRPDPVLHSPGQAPVAGPEPAPEEGRYRYSPGPGCLRFHEIGGFEPSRLEAARETMDKFIQQRNQDRISLVIFAGTAYTRIPLTLDHNILRASLQEVDVTSVNQDGTAIGMGISVALNRLKKSEAESKVVVLVTDGVNNAGSIDPLTAARLASEMGVRIYTIGVGTDETIMPVYIMGQKRYQRYAGGLDEELLREIAETTGGKYYRARDPKALDNIFKEINRLEKTSFERDNFQQYRELAYPLILAGLFLILIGLFLDRYYYIRIP